MCQLRVAIGRRRNTNAPASGASYAGRQARLRLSDGATGRRSILAFSAFSRKRSVRYVPFMAPGNEELSIKLVGDVLNLTVGSSTDKIVLLALANRADDKGRCWPSVATLVRETELSERSVQNALSRLKVRGLIEALPMRRRSSVYVIHIPAAGAPMGAARAPLRVHLTTFKGAPAAPLYVKDPSYEPSMNLKREDGFKLPVDKIRKEEVSEVVKMVAAKMRVTDG
jgi:DNA-binding transcriptional ArsR family regulator